MNKRDFNVVGNEGTDNQELAKGIAFVKSHRAELNVVQMVENMRDQAMPNGVIINDAYCDRSMTRDYDREGLNAFFATLKEEDFVECGKMLLKNGYKVKVLNTINFKKSMHYNPFAYIRSEKDILKLVNTIILNTKGEGQQATEDFWVKAEKLYYTALIGYIWYECVEEEQNFTTLLDMINASEAREDDEEFKNPVDLMFDELEEREPDHFAVKQYKKYKLAAGDICSK